MMMMMMMIVPTYTSELKKLLQITNQLSFRFEQDGDEALLDLIQNACMAHKEKLTVKMRAGVLFALQV